MVQKILHRHQRICIIQCIWTDIKKQADIFRPFFMSKGLCNLPFI